MAHAGVATSEKVTARFELLDIGLLHMHEGLEPELLERVMDEIRSDGYVKRPILVADGSFVILDGHHRYEALRRLGCRRVPAYLIDYFSDVVELRLWPTAKVKQVSKEEVIARGRSDQPYTPKTTRHVLRIRLPDVFTDLEDLM